MDFSLNICIVQSLKISNWCSILAWPFKCIWGFRFMIYLHVLWFVCQSAQLLFQEIYVSSWQNWVTVDACISWERYVSSGRSWAVVEHGRPAGHNFAGILSGLNLITNGLTNGLASLLRTMQLLWFFEATLQMADDDGDRWNGISRNETRHYCICLFIISDAFSFS
jgi:hypothetical protein